MRSCVIWRVASAAHGVAAPSTVSVVCASPSSKSMTQLKETRKKSCQHTTFCTCTYSWSQTTRDSMWLKHGCHQGQCSTQQFVENIRGETTRYLRTENVIRLETHACLLRAPYTFETFQLLQTREKRELSFSTHQDEKERRNPVKWCCFQKPRTTLVSKCRIRLCCMRCCFACSDP